MQRCLLDGVGERKTTTFAHVFCTSHIIKRLFDK